MLAKLFHGLAASAASLSSLHTTVQRGAGASH
jgi:hypothetical protein